MRSSLKRIILILVAIATVGPVFHAVVAYAATTPSTTAPTTPTSGDSNKSASAAAAAAARDAQHLANIKSKGDAEITRRLSSLNELSGKINAATKLTSSDKATLLAEVNSEISGLTDLKAKLDGETTVSAAVTDAQSIVSGYRVYALIVPKIYLVRAADDQLVVALKLNAFAAKLQTRLDNAKAHGKDTTSLQAQLNDLRTKAAAAQSIDTTVESKVIGLQPTDYNSDHAILSGYAAQLKTAHSDNQAAFTDAKSIIAGVKGL